MVCSLREQVDDTVQLLEALKKYHIDGDVEWPVERRETQLLRASLSIARKKVAALKSESLAHAGMQHAPAVQHHEPCWSEEHEPLAADQRDRTRVQAGMEASLGYLREPYRTAVYLHRVRGRSYQQIVDELQLPLGTVKSHVSRGLALLRTLQE